MQKTVENKSDEQDREIIERQIRYQRRMQRLSDAGAHARRMMFACADD